MEEQSLCVEDKKEGFKAMVRLDIYIPTPTTASDDNFTLLPLKNALTTLVSYTLLTRRAFTGDLLTFLCLMSLIWRAPGRIQYSDIASPVVTSPLAWPAPIAAATVIKKTRHKLVLRLSTLTISACEHLPARGGLTGCFCGILYCPPVSIVLFANRL